MRATAFKITYRDMNILTVLYLSNIELFHASTWTGVAWQPADFMVTVPLVLFFFSFEICQGLRWHK